MTLTCDECEKVVDVIGHFTFVSEPNKVIWKGDLCPNCQVALVNGKGLHNFLSVKESKN